MMHNTHDVLHRLSETLVARRNADPESSYTAQLFAKGPDAILKKIGEEASEVIIAAKTAATACFFIVMIFLLMINDINHVICHYNMLIIILVRFSCQ